MSGKAIKPLVLGKIFEIKKHLNSPIIGVGGITNAKDVLEYMILGCNAVQIYTEAHTKGLKVFKQIERDLKKELKHKKIKEIIGSFKV